MYNPLRKITTLAKELKKRYPNKHDKWTDYVKDASKQIKTGKKTNGIKDKVYALEDTVTKGIVKHYLGKKKATKKRVIKKKRKISGELHKDVKSHNLKINFFSGLFDTESIKNLDDLKKQYRELALKYHPDAGGTHEQFISLKAEYQKLFDKIINKSNLSEDQKNNERILDEALQNVVDSIIMLPSLKIEIIGKWIWVSGNTYPLKTELKKAGLVFIKKGDQPFWVYKGVESSGRGKLSLEEIRTKYGTFNIKDKKGKHLTGMPVKGIKLKKSKFLSNLKKITKSLNKRIV